MVHKSLALPLVWLMASACTIADARPSADHSAPARGMRSAAVVAPLDSGLSGKAFFYDDYTTYATTADLLKRIAPVAGGTGPADAMYNDGENADLLSIDESVTYNGHHTLKYSQPGRSVRTPQLWPTFPNGKSVTTMWFKAVIRFSPGFTTVGTTAGQSNAYKLFGWAWEGYDGRGTLEYTNTSQYTLNWQVVKRGGPVAPFAENNGPHVAREWTDGQWYQYVICREQLSPTTMRQRWWMAPVGYVPSLRGTVVGSMGPIAAPVPPVSSIRLGLNFNSQRVHDQALWYAQWEVVDGARYANPFGVGL